MAELAEIEIEIIALTERAFLVTDGDNKAWIPISLIEGGSDNFEGVGDSGIIIIPEWLAIEKNLV